MKELCISYSSSTAEIHPDALASAAAVWISQEIKRATLQPTPVSCPGIDIDAPTSRYNFLVEKDGLPSALRADEEKLTASHAFGRGPEFGVKAARQRSPRAFQMQTFQESAACHAGRCHRRAFCSSRSSCGLFTMHGPQEFQRMQKRREQKTRKLAFFICLQASFFFFFFFFGSKKEKVNALLNSILYMRATRRSLFLCYSWENEKSFRRRSFGLEIFQIHAAICRSRSRLKWQRTQ